MGARIHAAQDTEEQASQVPKIWLGYGPRAKENASFLCEGRGRFTFGGHRLVDGEWRALRPHVAEIC